MRHKIYTSSDGMSLRPVRVLVLLHSICSRGYKWPVINCGLVLRLDGHHVLDVDFPTEWLSSALPQRSPVASPPIPFRTEVWANGHDHARGSPFDPLVASRTMELVGRHVAVRVRPARVGRGGAPPPPPVARVGRDDTLPRGSDEAEP